MIWNQQSVLLLLLSLLLSLWRREERGESRAIVTKTTERRSTEEEDVWGVEMGPQSKQKRRHTHTREGRSDFYTCILHEKTGFWGRVQVFGVRCSKVNGTSWLVSLLIGPFIHVFAIQMQDLT
jgi:hypothetical protein